MPTGMAFVVQTADPAPSALDDALHGAAALASRGLGLLGGLWGAPAPAPVAAITPATPAAGWHPGAAAVLVVVVAGGVTLAEAAAVGAVLRQHQARHPHCAAAWLVSNGIAGPHAVLRALVGPALETLGFPE